MRVFTLVRPQLHRHTMSPLVWSNKEYKGCVHEAHDHHPTARSILARTSYTKLSQRRDDADISATLSMLLGAANYLLKRSNHNPCTISPTITSYLQPFTSTLVLGTQLTSCFWWITSYLRLSISALISSTQLTLCFW